MLWGLIVPIITSSIHSIYPFYLHHSQPHPCMPSPNRLYSYVVSPYFQLFTTRSTFHQFLQTVLYSCFILHSHLSSLTLHFHLSRLTTIHHQVSLPYTMDPLNACIGGLNIKQTLYLIKNCIFLGTTIDM